MTASPATDETFVDLHIDTVDCDDKPARINVCLSPEDFEDQIMVSLTTSFGHEAVYVTAETARELRAALDTVLAAHEKHFG